MTKKDYHSAAAKVFDIEIAELSRVRDNLDDAFDEAVETIRQQVHSGRKVLTVGVGKCSYIAAKIAATLTSTGCPALTLDSMNALHGDLGVVADGDVVIALSYSGETQEMLNFLNALRAFEVTIIAVTGNPKSELAHRCDLVISCRVEREACPLELAPTSSTTAMLVIGDALAMVLLEATGFCREDFARYHPAGSLGRKLLMTARDMMRPASDCAIVEQGALIRDALETMTAHRSGAAIIIDSEGRVAGIFTHGDFVRALLAEGGEITSSGIDQYMTSHPVTTNVDSLAIEVLGVLKTHKVDELIVADDQGRPVGIVDVQDLARLKLL